LRGSEDLGGGLAASFWLESALLPDTGAIAGAFFGRRSTLSLSSASWGELRLGRDYVPTLWNISAFTPLGTVGVGGAANIIFGWPNGHANAKTAVRASNSIGYHLPRTASGLYGQAMHAWGEGVDGTRYTGARIGWAAGPVDVAAAYGVTPAQGARYRTWTVGGTWLMEPVKLFANYHRHARLDDAQANITLGLSIGLGGGQLLASVARSDRKGPAVSADDARQVALGYVHPLSRRTDLYGTYAAIRNEGKASFATAGTPAGVAGQSARGIQFGVTHRF
jgi:predicted porin